MGMADRYVRSDTGSQMAVDLACAVGAEVLARLGSSPDEATIRSTVSAGIAPAVVSRWRAAVSADHQKRPFTTEERRRGGTGLDGDPLIAYGCTLIVALLGPSWGAIVQIGDGDAFVIDADGHTTAPVPTDDRLVGGETTSLCLPDAHADARYAILGAPLPELVVLTSDGYGNSFASREWRSEAGAGLSEAVHRDGLDRVAELLPGWLADSAVAGGDDVTMALVHRAEFVDPSPDGTPLTAGPIRSGSVASTAIAPAPAAAAPRAEVGLVLGALVAVILAGVGVGVGWFARGSGSTTPTQVAVESTTTIPVTPPTAAVPVEAPVAEVQRYAAVTRQGTVVTFQATDQPEPQVLLGTSGLRSHDPPKDPSGRRWTATAKSVKGTRSQSPTITITLPSVVDGGDLMLVESTLWVLSADGSRLWSIDTAEAKPSAQPAAGWPVP